MTNLLGFADIYSINQAAFAMLPRTEGAARSTCDVGYGVFVCGATPSSNSREEQSIVGRLCQTLI
jgi:hypothetical protein